MQVFLLTGDDFTERDLEKQLDNLDVKITPLPEEAVDYLEWNDKLRAKLADKEQRLLLVLRQREVLIKQLYETAKELELMNETQLNLLTHK